MMIEKIEEKWYTLNRYYYKEGFIDVYHGDSHHDPDLDEKPKIQINSSMTLYRLNGKGKWYHRNKLKGLFNSLNSDERELFSADEVWKDQFLKLFRRCTGMSNEHALMFVDNLEDFDNFEEKSMEYLKKNTSKLPINNLRVCEKGSWD
jgi:hypothetical protein